MTRQQLKNSGKLMKKSCMPKNDVTEGKKIFTLIVTKEETDNLFLSTCLFPTHLHNVFVFRGNRRNRARKVHRRP